MKKVGILMTSAFTNKKIFIEKDEIMMVEGSSEKGSNAKVYTKTKGNFYVKEKEEQVSEHAFDEVITVDVNDGL